MAVAIDARREARALPADRRRSLGGLPMFRGEFDALMVGRDEGYDG